MCCYNLPLGVATCSTISASGDLVPTSYVAACMTGRPDVRCLVDGASRQLSASEALAQVGLDPIEFGPKEALAVANAASVAASLAAVTLFDAGLAILLTQIVTGMAAEAMTGRLESFDPIVHELCLPHRGNIEVLTRIRDSDKIVRFFFYHDSTVKC
jgi:phenylalanine ammonia-lyase